MVLLQISWKIKKMRLKNFFLKLNNLEFKWSVAVSEICLRLVFFGSFEETSLDSWNTWFLAFRDCRQIASVRLNRFCLVSKYPPVLEGQYQDGQYNNQNQPYPPDLLFLVVLISFYISSYNFSQIFRPSFNIIWKKDFRHKFFFFNSFSQSSPSTP